VRDGSADKHQPRSGSGILLPWPRERKLRRRRRRRQTFWNISLAAFLSLRGLRVEWSEVCASFGDRWVSFLSGCFCKGVQRYQLHVEFQLCRTWKELSNRFCLLSTLVGENGDVGSSSFRVNYSSR
jgi:hypothetical protein